MDTKSELILLGGKPVREHYLPYGRRWIDEKDIQAVIEVLQNDFIANGYAIENFEKAVAEHVGAKYAVAFASGTAALHGACFAADIEKGDEVIVSPFTFPASSNCVLYQGGTPVFADVNLESCNIDPKTIEEKITKKTKAIIPVDFSGLPADLDEIKEIAEAHDLIVIEDAAHALGAMYKGEKVGLISDITIFSFNPVEHISSGEGGMAITNDKGFYHKLKQFREHGIIRETTELMNDYGSWHYEMQILGYNYSIADIQAALGISQLKKLLNFIQLRQNYATCYNKAFKNLEEIKCPVQFEDRKSSWYLYIVRLNLERLKGDRQTIFEALIKENIGVNVHCVPVYYHPYYEKLGYLKGLCPNAEQLYEEMIALPLFPAMDRQDIKDVIKAVKKVIGYYSTRTATSVSGIEIRDSRNR